MGPRRSQMDHHMNDPSTPETPAVAVNNVSKKFCRSLKRSLAYGVQDTIHDLAGRSLATIGLRKDEFWANHDVSFDVNRGECVGLIGHNGAGKTTVLKMLNGLIKPDGGSITLRGRVGALIALGAGFNPVLTGRENIFINGSVLGLSRREVASRLDEIIDFAEIGDFIDTPVRSYSSGMQVRLGFAVATALKPDILLIDEVLAVGDMDFRVKCMTRIKHLIDHGTAVVLVSHSMTSIRRVCTRTIVMDQGHVVHDGDVNLGVSTYEAVGHRQKSDAALRVSRSESQAVSVKALEVTVGEKISSSAYEHQILTGDRVRFSVTLLCEVPREGTRIRLFLDSREAGVVISLTSKIQLGEVNLPRGESTINVEVDSMPLRVGSYAIGLSIHSGDYDIVMKQKIVGLLKVTGPAVFPSAQSDAGIIQVSSNWDTMR